MRTAWLLLVCLGHLVAADLALTSVQERQGTFYDQPFWLRLRLPNVTYHDKRVLQLLYTVPAKQDLAGVVLRGHPDLLLDGLLRVFAWKERGDSGTALIWQPEQPDRAAGYRGTLEWQQGDALRVIDLQRPCPAPIWDRQLAPLLVLLADPNQLPLRVPIGSLLHCQDPDFGRLELHADELLIDDQRYAVQRAADGAIERITDADGQAIVTVGPVPVQPLDSAGHED